MVGLSASSHAACLASLAQSMLPALLVRCVMVPMFQMAEAVEAAGQEMMVRRRQAGGRLVFCAVCVLMRVLTRLRSLDLLFFPLLTPLLSGLTCFFSRALPYPRQFHFLQVQVITVHLASVDGGAALIDADVRRKKVRILSASLFFPFTKFFFRHCGEQRWLTCHPQLASTRFRILVCHVVLVPRSSSC